MLHVHDANRQGPTGRPRFLPVSWPPPGRDGAYAMQPRSPSRRSLIGLGLQHKLLAGYTINVSRLANRK